MVHYAPTTDCYPLLEYTKLSGDQTGNLHTNFNIGGLSPYHCCCGKAISITYSQCVSVALIIQHAEPMLPIVLLSAVYLAVQYFSTLSHKRQDFKKNINPLNPELNPICYLLALLGAHHFLHVSRIRVKLLTFRLLISYIYGASILDVSRSHTTTQHSR